LKQNDARRTLMQSFLCGRYKYFDLKAREDVFPILLSWWLIHKKYDRKSGLTLDIFFNSCKIKPASEGRERVCADFASAAPKGQRIILRKLSGTRIPYLTLL